MWKFGVVFTAIWLISGFIAWGLTLGTFTKRFPYFKNTDAALPAAITGPLGLIAALIAAAAQDQQLSWRIKPLNIDERWKAYHKRFPSLSYESFKEDN